ncbi:hypothetical protein OQA88_7371 [Cercophora sp. LCS_1]
MSSELATKAFVKAEIETLRVATEAFVKTEIDNFRAEVKVELDNIHHKIGRLEADVGEVKITMGEMQVTMRQIDIRTRNGKLKNPISRIRPIPIFTQGRGAQEPDPANFPRYADQFYGLRKPQKERDYQMLVYLSKFYDIWQEAVDQSIQEIDPERAVELLEEILGLEEDNFVPSDGSPTVPFTNTPSRAPPRGPAPRAPSDGSPTVPFTETPSRAPPRYPAPTPRAPSDGSPTVPFTETPSRAAPERLLAARPRRPSATIPDSEETASS